MKKLFNDNWVFALTDADENAVPEDFAPVDIPHDWLIYNTNELYKTGFGHYRRILNVTVEQAEMYNALYFEGVYMNCTVYVNGEAVCDNKYGYSSFTADLTGKLRAGDNTIDVKVRFEAPNSRWYSGAGIFRDVWHLCSPRSRLVQDGVYFHADKKGEDWECSLFAETMNAPEGSQVVIRLSHGSRTLYADALPAEELVKTVFTLKNISPAEIWDIHSPNLLDLDVSLVSGSLEFNRVTCRVGLKDARFDPDKGFILNGRQVKLHGVCLHHDLGCLGAAFNRSAAERQLSLMQEMGVNSVRTSHNPPAEAFMQLCDEMGILVDSEMFDMWERPKTEFDYARFFDEWYERDVTNWVRRDRNHPSVIMWSVGNEIYDTHASPRGAEVAEMLHNAVRKHDPLCNAPTTIGSNYMPWEGAQNSARKVDLVGYNYGENLYEQHHRENPGWKIYGSETTSGGKSRGIYHFPLSSVYLTHEDHQCSSLGNCRSGISFITAQKVIALDRDTPFCAGMYIWTGADYIGEPTPYSTKNSYFGCIDTAGLKKDIFWLYQAAWTDKPVLRLMPSWDLNLGQAADAVVYTNCPEVELFLNGVSLGRKKPEEYTADWQLTYQPGELKAVGYCADGTTLTDIRHSFGDTENLVIQTDSKTINVGEDIAVFEISAADKDWNPVENANDRIFAEVKGGRLVGFDNGDSTDYEQYKSATRRLFSGKAAVYAAADGSAPELTVRVFTADGKRAVCSIPAVSLSHGELEDKFPGAAVTDRGTAFREGAAHSESITLTAADRERKDIPVRRIRLVRNTDAELTREQPESEIAMTVHPANATYTDLNIEIVTDSGVPVPLAQAQRDGNKITVKALADGAFRLRVTANNGKPHADVVSELEYTAGGLGSLCFDPYSFTVGCLYSDSLSVMDEVRGGGVGIKKDNNIVGFRKVDFGKYGANGFTMRCINWHSNDPFGFRLWLGYPGAEGSREVGSFTYQADFIWQTYIDNSYTFSETVKGVQDVYFEFEKNDMRIDFGGFEFVPNNKAYMRINAADNDLLHGDSYEVSGAEVINIGNNVFMDFKDMRFDRGTKRITLTGRTHHETDSVHVSFSDESGEVFHTVLEFAQSSEYTEVSAGLPELNGTYTVSVFFLPGCDFDFSSFVIE